MFKPTDDYDVEVIKKGRRRLGDLLTFKSGKKLFVAPFSHADMYLFKTKKLSEAMRQDNAYLWLTTTEISKLMRLGVEYVGFQMRANKDIYLTKLAMFKDVNIRKTTYLGSKTIVGLPISVFRQRNGEIKF